MIDIIRLVNGLLGHNGFTYTVITEGDEVVIFSVYHDGGYLGNLSIVSNNVHWTAVGGQEKIYDMADPDFSYINFREGIIRDQKVKSSTYRKILAILIIANTGLATLTYNLL